MRWLIVAALLSACVAEVEPEPDPETETTDAALADVNPGNTTWTPPGAADAGADNG